MNTLTNKPKQPERFRTTTDEREIIRKIEILTRSVERVYPHLSTLMWRSFIQGVFIALGSTVGLAIIITIASFILNELRFLPVVSDFLNAVNIQQFFPKR